MKRYFAIIICGLFSFSIIAQTGAYKKLLAEKETLDLDFFLSGLKEYQAENAQYGNVYYQIGKLELDRFSRLDPITERLASRQYIYNAKTNFGLAKNFLDDKDVLKNPEWYDVPDMKNRDSVKLLGIQNIENSFQNVQNYAILYEDLVKHNDRAISNYLAAREAFISINTSYPNLRQLFLKADDSLKSVVSYIGDKFDSSMYHLNEYRETYKKLPHYSKRRVKVNLLEIDHFRMNGITPVNFLSDEIDLWDYKNWSEGFKELMAKEVDGLHEEINQAYLFFQKTNDRMLFGDDCIQANIDNLKFQRIINLITKYDSKSSLIDIFQYLIGKLDYGNQYAYETKCNILDELPSDDLLSRKSRIYLNLFEAYIGADTLADQIITRENNEESFKWFFEETMTIDGGSKSFSNQQKAQNDTTFKEEVKKLADLRDFQLFKTDTLSDCYGVTEDGLLLTKIGDYEREACIKKVLPLNEQFHLLQAVELEQSQLIGAGVLPEEYEILWTLETPNSDTISYFKLLSDSLFVMAGYGEKPWLQLIKTNGEVQRSVNLNSADTIINIQYNELQGVLRIVQFDESQATISMADFSGSITETVEKSIEGDLLSNIIDGKNLYLISHEVTEEGSMVHVYSLGNEGEWQDPVTYYLANDIVDPILIKNDNESMTLLGANEEAPQKIIYAVLNYEGDVLHEKVL